MVKYSVLCVIIRLPVSSFPILCHFLAYAPQISDAFQSTNAYSTKDILPLHEILLLGTVS